MGLPGVTGVTHSAGMACCRGSASQSFTVLCVRLVTSCSSASETFSFSILDSSSRSVFMFVCRQVLIQDVVSDLQHFGRAVSFSM